MNERPGPQLHPEFFGRLRARPLSSWRVGDRELAARTAVDQLAALGWPADMGAVPAVPYLGPHALADQLEVLVIDAAAAGADSVPVLRALAEKLSVRLD